MSNNSRSITKIRLDNLRPHPRQAELFPPRSDAELAELAADIKARGLQHPIEVLPDGTVVAGHERLRAAQLLQWVEIDCFVRHDLAAQGDVAIEQHLIGDNLHGKQLSKLVVARCAWRLKELIVGGELNKLPFDDRCEAEASVRDRIGHRLGMSGRNAGRLLAIRHSPLEVQLSYDRGEISLVQAGKPAMVHEELREKVVADIRAGVHPKDAIDRHIRFGRRAKKRNEPTKAYAVFLKAIEKASKDVGEHIDEVFPVAGDYTTRVQFLESSIALLQRLVEREHTFKERQAVAVAAVAERIGARLAAIESNEMAVGGHRGQRRRRPA